MSIPSLKSIASLIAFYLMLSAAASAQSTAPSRSFWKNLQNYCGQSFEGQVMAAPAGDTNFTGKRLIMEVKACEDGRIRIPFHVGNNHSRTWVLTLQDSLLQLKHDHRHEDGRPDRVTQYGGMAPSTGTPTLQFFPADQYTVNLLPTAAANVWWIELEPGKHFTYHLRRLGTDRQYSIRFDLTKPVSAPPAPWGW
jgi:hypothetical protein